MFSNGEMGKVYFSRMTVVSDDDKQAFFFKENPHDLCIHNASFSMSQV